MNHIAYYTAEGLNKLKEELLNLKTAGRKKVAMDIAEARSKGDLSENAEYDAAQESQERLENRIRELENIILNARILSKSDLDISQVGLLSKVTVFNETANKQFEYTIVSEMEANLKEWKISSNSPIAQALIGHKIGEIVFADTPAGKLKLKILKIEI